MASVFFPPVFDDDSRSYYFGETNGRNKVIMGQYLRPAAENDLSDEESKKRGDAIKTANVCFSDVAFMIGRNRDVSLSLPYHTLREYALKAYNGQASCVDIREKMYRRAEHQIEAADKRVEPNPYQETTMTSALKEAKEFLLHLGVRHSIPKVFFLPENVIAENEKRPDLVVAGLHADLIGSIFINRNRADYIGLTSTIIHECIHFNSRTSLPISLNEGLTTYFTTLFWMDQQGVSDLSAASVMKSAKDLSEKCGSNCAYVNNLELAAHIADKAGLYAVTQAYFYGDTNALIKGLGEDTWRNMFLCSLNEDNIIDKRKAELLITMVDS